MKNASRLDSVMSNPTSGKTHQNPEMMIGLMNTPRKNSDFTLHFPTSLSHIDGLIEESQS